MTRPETISSPATSVVGLQWGDEGKGKIVDRLAVEHDAVVRYNGGANAGHSVVVAGERYALHLVPSGILYPGVLAVIANGVVVDPDALARELAALRSRGVQTSGLVLSDRAHVVMPYHKREDEVREELLKAAGDPSEIGTTRRGIGPCYADKVQRASAVRVADLFNPTRLREKLASICLLKNALFRGLGVPDQLDPDDLALWAAAAADTLRPHVRDTTYLLHDLLASGKRLLFEGANATLLDVDHGTFPFVTSSSCSTPGIGPGTGVPTQCVSRVVGVMKAYSTRVGRGPLPTELLDDIGDRIRTRGREFGTTTGRPRRVGWLDLVGVRYSAMINGATELAVTLLDVLSGIGDLRLCTAYRRDGRLSDRFSPSGDDLATVLPEFESLPGFDGDLSTCRRLADLPTQARRYLERIEAFVGVPITMVGVGPARDELILTTGAA